MHLWLLIWLWLLIEYMHLAGKRFTEDDFYINGHNHYINKMATFLMELYCSFNRSLFNLFPHENDWSDFHGPYWKIYMKINCTFVVLTYVRHGMRPTNFDIACHIWYIPPIPIPCRTLPITPKLMRHLNPRPNKNYKKKLYF